MDPRNQPSLLERIYSWENLLDAYHEAASEKWYRNDVTAFAANLEENLISIQNDLIWHTYKVGRYRQFYVHEPKKRLVMALGFRDRVVQWARNNYKLRPYTLWTASGKVRRRDPTV